jgi:hypothetical protein
MKINGTESMSWRRPKPFVALFLISFCNDFGQRSEINNGKPALAPKIINIWPGVARLREKQKGDHDSFRSMESFVNVTTPTFTAYHLPDRPRQQAPLSLLPPAAAFFSSARIRMRSRNDLRPVALRSRLVPDGPGGGDNDAQLGQSRPRTLRAQIRNLALIAEDGKYALTMAFRPSRCAPTQPNGSVSPDRVVFMGFSAGGMIRSIRPSSRM